MDQKHSLYLTVRKVINKYDPIKLIAIDCPLDEYNGEVKRIINILDRTSDFNEVLESIYQVFVKMFDEELAGPKESYQKLTTELLKLKNSS